MQNKTLTDFEPEKVKQRQTKKAEEQKVMELLRRFSAEMLKDAMRECHPKPEWGDEETWRYHYIDECRRRGTRLLEQLGWPTNENSLYVNLHAGSVESLIDIATNNGYFADRYTIADQAWSVIEHWEPYEPEKPNICKIKYLENEVSRIKKLKAGSKRDVYIKSDIKKLPEYKKEIESEKSKSIMGDANSKKNPPYIHALVKRGERISQE